jgi:hypothetical protein
MCVFLSYECLDIADFGLHVGPGRVAAERPGVMVDIISNTFMGTITERSTPNAANRPGGAVTTVEAHWRVTTLPLSQQQGQDCTALPSSRSPGRHYLITSIAAKQYSTSSSDFSFRRHLAPPATGAGSPINRNVTHVTVKRWCNGRGLPAGPRSGMLCGCFSSFE